MEYDFYTLCSDQLDNLQKKLAATNKSYVAEYLLVSNVIIHPNKQEQLTDMELEINDLLNDAANQARLIYTTKMRLVQEVLTKYLV